MSESDEQVAVVQWFRMQYPKEIIFAIPNGSWIAGTGGRKFALINKYKNEGLTPGVSDLFIAASRWNCHGMFIEMKDKGKTLCSVSKEQLSFLSATAQKDYCSIWAFGFDDAKTKIEAYMNQTKPK